MTAKTNTPTEIAETQLDDVAGGKGMNKLAWDPALERVGGSTLNIGNYTGSAEIEVNASSSGHYTQVVWAKT